MKVLSVLVSVFLAAVGGYLLNNFFEPSMEEKLDAWLQLQAGEILDAQYQELRLRLSYEEERALDNFAHHRRYEGWQEAITHNSE